MAIFLGVMVAFGICYFIVAAYKESKEAEHVATLSNDEREQFYKEKEEQRREEVDSATWGETKPSMVCPHCQAKGQVRTRQVDRKAGISGGKATAALLTAGVSMLATGLSRKETLTQAHCTNCDSTWHF